MNDDIVGAMVMRSPERCKLEPTFRVACMIRFFNQDQVNEGSARLAEKQLFKVAFRGRSLGDAAVAEQDKASRRPGNS